MRLGRSETAQTEELITSPQRARRMLATSHLAQTPAGWGVQRPEPQPAHIHWRPGRLLLLRARSVLKLVHRGLFQNWCRPLTHVSLSEKNIYFHFTPSPDS